jgi:hypothetical protein
VGAGKGLVEERGWWAAGYIEAALWRRIGSSVGTIRNVNSLRVRKNVNTIGLTARGGASGSCFRLKEIAHHLCFGSFLLHLHSEKIV